MTSLASVWRSSDLHSLEERASALKSSQEVYRRNVAIIRGLRSTEVREMWGAIRQSPEAVRDRLRFDSRAFDFSCCRADFGGSRGGVAGTESWVPRTTVGMNGTGGALAGKGDGAEATVAMMDVGERAGEALDVGRSGDVEQSRTIISFSPRLRLFGSVQSLCKSPHFHLVIFSSAPLLSLPHPVAPRLFLLAVTLHRLLTATP